MPAHHRTELAAIVAEGAPLGAMALIDAKAPGVGIAADMACLDDDEVLAVIGVGTVAVGRDLAADRP
jgi:hypothetical protein